jgi:hypothetical protein
MCSIESKTSVAELTLALAGALACASIPELPAQDPSRRHAVFLATIDGGTNRQRTVKRFAFRWTTLWLWSRSGQGAASAYSLLDPSRKARVISR